MTESAAVIFDLDGVLTDTISLHFESWKPICAELGVAFDHDVNDTLRGLSRPESLDRLLGPRAAEMPPTQKQLILARKNELYLQKLHHMSPADLFPGIQPLLRDLRTAGFKTAVASSSRNAISVVERLGIRDLFDIVLDANEVPNSKPDPAVFLETARRLEVTPARCIVIEDGEAGIQAAWAAKMKVIGVGAAARKLKTSHYAADAREITKDLVSRLLNHV